MLQDGFLFYWIAWLLWGWLTFLSSKNKSRLIFAGFVLIIIAISNYNFNIMDITISSVPIILLVGSIIYFMNSRRITYNIGATLAVGTGFSGVLIWNQVYSISLFVSTYVLFTLAMILLVAVFARNLNDRVFISLGGMAVGQMVYDFVLWNYGFTQFFGEKVFLDYVALTVAVLLVRNQIETWRLKLKSYVSLYKEKLEKEY